MMRDVLVLDEMVTGQREEHEEYRSYLAKVRTLAHTETDGCLPLENKSPPFTSTLPGHWGTFDFPVLLKTRADTTTGVSKQERIDILHSTPCDFHVRVQCERRAHTRESCSSSLSSDRV